MFGFCQDAEHIQACFSQRKHNPSAEPTGSIVEAEEQTNVIHTYTLGGLSKRADVTTNLLGSHEMLLEFQQM